MVKVTVNTPGSNRVSVSGQNSQVVKQVGVETGTALVALETANQALYLAQGATSSTPAFQQANLALSTAQSAFNAANTAVTDYSPAFNQANLAYSLAQTAFIQANTAPDIANSYATAVGVSSNSYASLIGTSGNSYSILIGTSSNSYAISVGASGNTYSNSIGTSSNSYTTEVGTSGNSYAITVGASSNAWSNSIVLAANNYSGQMANSANAKANTVGISANNFAGSMANSSNSFAGQMANSANARANTVGSSANAYAATVGTGANSYAASVGTAGNTYATSVGTSANSYATAVGTSGNNYTLSSFNKANDAYTIAVAAYNNANSKLSISGGTITGDLSIVGSLYISGNSQFQNVTTLSIGDPLIYLAANNYVSDIVDIGFIANYVNATGANVHTGLYREHEDKMYYLFQGYDREPANNHIGALSNNMTLAVLNADIRTSNLVLFGANAQQFIIGAFTQANAAPGIANSYATAVGSAGNSYATAVGTSGNTYAESVGVGANSYAASVGTSANSYATSVGTSSNAYSVSIGTSGNSYATAVGTAGNTFASSVGVGANSYATSVGTSSNNYATLIGASSNAWSNTVVISANNYAGTMANSANGFATTIGASSNTWANSIVTAANNYAGQMANSANARANTVGTSANAYAAVIAGAAFNKANSTTYTSNVVISVTDNTNAALRITQTGTGDSIRVEDSANPDSTPFVVSNTGLVGIGTTNPTELLDVQGQTLGFVFGKGITLKAESVTGAAAYPGGSLKFIAGYGAPGGGSGPGGTGGHLFTHAGTAITTPSYFFHVDGGVGTGGYGNAPNPDIFIRAVSVNIAQSAATAGNIYFAAGKGTPNGSIYLRTLDVDRLQIDPSGNVLIGRSTSTVGQNVLLDIAGAANVSNLLINGQSIISILNGANTAVGAGANSWANSIVTAANNYAGQMANSANARANSVGASSNSYTLSAFNQANTALTTAQAAFDKANTANGSGGGNNSASLTGTSNTQIIYNNQGSANGSNNFVYDFANNTVIIGSSDSQNIIYGEPAEKLQIHWTRPGVDEYPGGIIGISAWANSAYGTELHFTKSRGSSVGDHVAVKNGDDFFWIVGGGSDGSTFTGDSVGINGTVDGIPFGTSIPGRLTFWTTSPGDTYGAERMRIDANGKVGIGTSSPQYTLEVSGSFAAQTKSFVINHPTQPGKKLRYGSLEGPENGVYIRGRTQEDSIELPDYWTELIDENSITVMLTPIGNTKMPYVKSIQDNTIYLGTTWFSKIDCYFHIFAERKDVPKLIVEF